MSLFAIFAVLPGNDSLQLPFEGNNTVGGPFMGNCTEGIVRGLMDLVQMQNSFIEELMHEIDFMGQEMNKFNEECHYALNNLSSQCVLRLNDTRVHLLNETWFNGFKGFYSNPHDIDWYINQSLRVVFMGYILMCILKCIKSKLCKRRVHVSPAELPARQTRVWLRIRARSQQPVISNRSMAPAPETTTRQYTESELAEFRDLALTTAI